MEHLVFLYYIVCYTLGGIGLLVAVLKAATGRVPVERCYVVFMGVFTLLVVSVTVSVYAHNIGFSDSRFRSLLSFVTLAGCSLMAAVLPRFIHALVVLPFERTINRIFAATGFAALAFAALALAGAVFPFAPDGIVFSLLIVSIAYSTTIGNVYARKRKKSGTGDADFSRWCTIMKSISILTVAFLPLFVVIDFFPEAFPRITRNLPKTLCAFPLFYALWNLVYAVRTIPLLFGKTKGKAAEEWDFSRFGLSPREREVAFALTKGYSYKEIADRLSISLATVKTHVNRIYEKTGTGNKMEFARKLRNDPER
jgi:DNA-binding CsgD family transcriptional regulator